MDRENFDNISFRSNGDLIYEPPVVKDNPICTSREDAKIRSNTIRLNKQIVLKMIL